MDYLERLDEILLGDSAKDKFNKAYKDKAFRSWICSVLPEVDACYKMKQNNPWHIYGVLDHILASVDEMNKRTGDMPYADRRMLAYTMFFHDIGKPKCHLTRMKNGKLIDSFFNHNKESRRVAERSLGRFGFNQEDSRVISKLVEDHDIFMFLTIDKTNNPYKKQVTREVVQGEIDALNEVGDGKKLIGWLCLVGESDNGAQNPEMTADSIKLVDYYSQVSDEIIGEMDSQM